MFRGVFGMLGIELSSSLVYTPRGKSRMERWFDVLHEQFDKGFVTYTGGTVVDKPESLEKIVKKAGNVPTLEYVRGHLATFIDAYNASADHAKPDLVDDEGQPLSPNEALRLWCPRTRVLPQPEALRLLAAKWIGPVKANKRGVVISPHGVPVGYGQFDHVLARFKGGQAANWPALFVSYEPRDLSTVNVWDADFRWVAELRENEKGAGTAAQRANAAKLLKQQREYRKAMKTVSTNRMVEFLTPAERLADLEADRRRDTSDDNPPPLRLVDSPITGSPPATDNDEPQRLAATGTEDDAPAPIDWESIHGGEGGLAAFSAFADAADDGPSIFELLHGSEGASHGE